MSDFRKFVQFVKVDSAKREVWGVVTAELPDKDGETCDYEGTKPHYKAWSEEFVKATDGKSCGNLRYMHTLRVVGKGIGIEFRDTDKEIFMGFKVTDDDAWNDVEEGVLTGFSQGGKYVSGPDRQKRYVAQPSEVSLVDNPCLGAAHFAYVKADGAIEMRKARSTPLVKATAEEKTQVIETPVVVKTAEPAAGFTLPPITIEQALRAARGEDPQLTAEQLAAFETLKALVAKSAPVVETVVETAKKTVHPQAVGAIALVDAALEDVKKGMYSVSRFAELLEQLAWLQRMAEVEAATEEDDSAVPGELLDKLKDLCETFLAMAEEEAAELAAGGSGGEFYYAAKPQIQKFFRFAQAALAKQKTAEAGTPAPQGDTMENNTGTDLLLKAGGSLKTHLAAMKKAAEDHSAKLADLHDKCMKCMGEEAEKTVAAGEVVKTDSADLAKAAEAKVNAVIAAMETKFTAFMETLGKTLEAPKAAQTNVGTLVTKTQDSASPAAAAEVLEAAEPSFVPAGQPNANMPISDAARAAFKTVRGIALG